MSVTLQNTLTDKIKGCYSTFSLELDCSRNLSDTRVPNGQKHHFSTLAWKKNTERYTEIEA